MNIWAFCELITEILLLSVTGFSLFESETLTNKQRRLETCQSWELDKKSERAMNQRALKLIWFFDNCECLIIWLLKFWSESNNIEHWTWVEHFDGIIIRTSILVQENQLLTRQVRQPIGISSEKCFVFFRLRSQTCFFAKNFYLFFLWFAWENRENSILNNFYWFRYHLNICGTVNVQRHVRPCGRNKTLTILQYKNKASIFIKGN